MYKVMNYNRIMIFYGELNFGCSFKIWKYKMKWMILCEKGKMFINLHKILYFNLLESSDNEKNQSF